MNKNEAQTKKEQEQKEFEYFSSRLKAHWNRLTDEDIALCETNEDQFYELLNDKFGVERDEAERKVHAIIESLRKQAA